MSSVRERISTVNEMGEYLMRKGSIDTTSERVTKVQD